MGSRLLDVVCPEGGGRIATVQGFADGSLYLLHSARRWTPSRNWERLDSWIRIDPPLEVAELGEAVPQLLEECSRLAPELVRLYELAFRTIASTTTRWLRSRPQFSVPCTC